MQRFLLATLAVTAVYLATMVRPGACSPSMGGAGDAAGNGIGRPSRPQVFTSPDELRAYLEQLSNYFAIAGRPRFGKRVGPAQLQLTQQFRPMASGLESRMAASQLSENSSNEKRASPSDAYPAGGSPADLGANYRHSPEQNPGPNEQQVYQLLFPYDK